MELDLKPKQEEWRRRGRVPMELSQEIFDLLSATYGTGRVGVIRFDPDNDDDVAEMQNLLSQLRSGANRQGKRLAVQETGYNEGIIRYEMRDRARPRNRSKKPEPEPVVQKTPIKRVKKRSAK